MLVAAIAASLVLLGQVPGGRAHAGHHPTPPVITDAEQVDSHRRQHRSTGHNHRAASHRATQRPAVPAEAAEAAAGPGHNNKLAPQMYEYLTLGSTSRRRDCHFADIPGLRPD